MHFSNGMIRVGGRRLPEVLDEITQKLIADDWCQCATNDGHHSYYVVGWNDHLAHASGGADYPISEFPRPVRTRPLAEWFVRSQAAEVHQDYLQKAKQRLEAAGVSLEALDSFLAGDFSIYFNFKDSIFR